MSTEKKPRLAQNVVMNWDTKRLTIDGEPFPFYMAKEGPTVAAEPLVEHPPALYIVHVPLLANGLTEVGEKPQEPREPRVDFGYEVGKMQASLNLGLMAEEEGFLPPMTDEQLRHLAGWLIGDGWVKP